MPYIPKTALRFLNSNRKSLPPQHIGVIDFPPIPVQKMTIFPNNPCQQNAAIGTTWPKQSKDDAPMTEGASSVLRRVTPTLATFAPVSFGALEKIEIFNHT